MPKRVVNRRRAVARSPRHRSRTAGRCAGRSSLRHESNAGDLESGTTTLESSSDDLDLGLTLRYEDAAGLLIRASSHGLA
nr:unnamed protein product [Digitaria exilis]